MGLLRSKGDFIMEENQKKRSGFGSGMFVGFLLGILLLGIGVTVGVHVYTTSTNQYLVISPSGVKKTAESLRIKR